MLVAITVLSASCGTKKKAMETSQIKSASENVKLGKEAIVAYKSLGNGVASIDLQLYENDTFKFDFTSIPQPEDGGDTIKISEKGNYTSDGNWKTLKFDNPKFDVPSLFDVQYGDASQFKIVDGQTVKINSISKIINIWGVACQKQ